MVSDPKTMQWEHLVDGGHYKAAEKLSNEHVATKAGGAALSTEQLIAATDPLPRRVGDPVPGTPGVVNHAAIQTAIDVLRAEKKLEF